MKVNPESRELVGKLRRQLNNFDDDIARELDEMTAALLEAGIAIGFQVRGDLYWGNVAGRLGFYQRNVDQKLGKDVLVYQLPRNRRREYITILREADLFKLASEEYARQLREYVEPEPVDPPGCPGPDQDLEQNLRDFGPDKTGREIIAAYRKAVGR